MNYDYKYHLLQQLITLQTELGLSNFDFTIEEEQDFIKRKDYDPNTIYIVIKYLTDTKQVGASVQPVQLLILTEQNSLDVTKILFNNFSDSNNWHTYTYTYTDDSNNSHTIYIKQQYSAPVVLSNFNPVLDGYHSVVYVSATLFVMEDYADVTELTIGLETIEAIDFSVNYSMTTNTQQVATQNISSSVKNVSTVNISLTIPTIYAGLIENIRKTLGGTNTGDEDYAISFKLGGTTVSYNMKLISVNLVTAPNQVPSLKLGFIK